MVLGQKHGTNYLPYTLETHLVVESKRTRHKRCTTEYYAKIAFCIGQYRFGGAEEVTYVSKERKSDNRYKESESETIQQSRDCHTPCLLRLL